MACASYTCQIDIIRLCQKLGVYNNDTLPWTGLQLRGVRTLYVGVRFVVYATTTIPKNVPPMMSMRASSLHHG